MARTRDLEGDVVTKKTLGVYKSAPSTQVVSSAECKFYISLVAKHYLSV